MEEEGVWLLARAEAEGPRDREGQRGASRRFSFSDQPGPR